MCGENGPSPQSLCDQKARHESWDVIVSMNVDYIIARGELSYISCQGERRYKVPWRNEGDSVPFGLELSLKLVDMSGYPSSAAGADNCNSQSVFDQA